MTSIRNANRHYFILAIPRLPLFLCSQSEPANIRIVLMTFIFSNIKHDCRPLSARHSINGDMGNQTDSKSRDKGE